PARRRRSLPRHDHRRLGGPPGPRPVRSRPSNRRFDDPGHGGGGIIAKGNSEAAHLTRFNATFVSWGTAKAPLNVAVARMISATVWPTAASGAARKLSFASFSPALRVTGDTLIPLTLGGNTASTR